MQRRFSDEELHAIRNFIPVRFVIEQVLEIPNKEIEGCYRFLCPACSEFQTGVNPRTNLSRCFRCARNFNTIELVMSDRGLGFVESVKLLAKYRAAHSNEHPQRSSSLNASAGVNTFKHLSGVLLILSSVA